MSDDDRPSPERCTARLDAFEREAREQFAAQLALIGDMRRDLTALGESQDDDHRAIVGLRGGQDSLTAEVGAMRTEQRGLSAQVSALASRVPTGGAVVAAGGAAGAPALVLLVVEAVRWLSTR